MQAKVTQKTSVETMLKIKEKLSLELSKKPENILKILAEIRKKYALDTPKKKKLELSRVS